jgi:hypothetical protein|tara:strand:- start:1116 stop:1301 length:186 start_codon:yes stop_codon:yes gene_type:complete
MLEPSLLSRAPIAHIDSLMEVGVVVKHECCPLKEKKNKEAKQASSTVIHASTGELAGEFFR